MRLILSIAFFALSTASFAQLNGHFSFTWTFIEEGIQDTRNVEIFSNSKFFAVKGTVADGSTETTLINRIGKAGLELFSDFLSETERDNYYSQFGWEEQTIDEANYVSDIFGGLLSMPNFNNGFELLNEKSTIMGVACQKFQIILPEGVGKITGWIATDKHCLIDGEFYYLDTDKGMILEMVMEFPDNKLEIKCTAFDTKYPETSPIFNMEIPEGYDNLESEYVDEEEVEEESGDE